MPPPLSVVSLLIVLMSATPALGQPNPAPSSAEVTGALSAELDAELDRLEQAARRADVASMTGLGVATALVISFIIETSMPSSSDSFGPTVRIGGIPFVLGGAMYYVGAGTSSAITIRATRLARSELPALDVTPAQVSALTWGIPLPGLAYSGRRMQWRRINAARGQVANGDGALFALRPSFGSNTASATLVVVF